MYVYYLNYVCIDIVRRNLMLMTLGNLRVCVTKKTSTTLYKENTTIHNYCLVVIFSTRNHYYYTWPTLQT